MRALLRPLIRKVHPDLIPDAPQIFRDENAKHLATLHALIDNMESGDFSKLSSRYSFNFYTRADTSSDRDSAGEGPEAPQVEQEWRNIPTSITRAG